MKTIVPYLLKLAAFWWAIFFMHRLSLLAIYHVEIPADAAWLPSLFRGWLLDLSAIGYFLAWPCLGAVLHTLLVQEGLRRLLRWLMDAYMGLLLTTVALLHAAELATYGDWHSKVNSRIFFYLGHLQEGFRAATFGHYLMFFGGLMLAVGGGFWIYWRFIRLRETTPAPARRLPSLLVGLGCLGLLAIAARGSLDSTPVNLGDAFYSPHIMLNDVATNTPWNFISSVREHMRDGDQNPYATYAPARAAEAVQRLYASSSDTFPQILTTQRPNIVLIIQEGMSADMVGALGGQVGFTPQYDRLAAESIVFTNMFSAGWTSDVGHLSILSAFPALPQANLITQPDKYRKLPSVIKSLKKVGYDIAYYYGGQSSYGNIKGYLIDHGVDAVLDEDVLASQADEGRLGIHDGYMFAKFAADMPQDKGPWCRIMFTLSTHTPFDIPVTTGLSYKGLQEDYARAAYYSDSAFGKMVDHLKASGQWENTLLLVIPDHSQNSVIQRRSLELDHYHIGMMISGGALKPEYRGLKIAKLVSQLDFAGTILPQLGLDAAAFHWSKNMLALDFPEFAYYAWSSGIGWLRPNGTYVEDYAQKALYEEEFVEPWCRDSILVEGRAFLQQAQAEYLGL